MQSFIQLLAAGVGSFGYALFFNVRGRDILLASLGGLISWGIYLSSRLIVSSDPLCYFISAFLFFAYINL